MFTLKSHKKINLDYEIVCHFKPSIFDRLFGDREGDRTFVGSGTVFHELPSWNRCPTNIEVVLSSFHSKIKFKEGSPTTSTKDSE